MSDYTPTEQELIEGSTVSEDERRRAIARIKAEALREALLSDEAVLRALNAEEPRAATDNLADWGEESIARMRAALAAALGEDESDE